MSIPSNSITSNAIRENMPPYRLSANPRQASFAPLKPQLRQRDNPPDRRAAAPAPVPESTFPGINRMARRGRSAIRRENQRPPTQEARTQCHTT